jgi:ASC-1-like (ASCH) protein
MCIVREEVFTKKYIYVTINMEVDIMEHILKLQPRYFDYINEGTKRVELRLYDEKRQQINIGDTIIFQKEPELETTMKVKVIGLLRYNSFEELFNDFCIEIMADKSMTKQELLNVLEEFYTPEKQKQYGVVGIRIEKI